MHMQRLNDIETKLNMLLEEKGITWAAHDLRNELKVGAKKRNILSRCLQGMRWRVVIAIKFTQLLGGKLMQMNKAILIPLLSAIALFVKQAFNYDLPSEYVNIGADIILFAITILGTFLHPKKKGKDKDGISITFERTE